NSRAFFALTVSSSSFFPSTYTSKSWICLFSTNLTLFPLFFAENYCSVLLNCWFLVKFPTFTQTSLFVQSLEDFSLSFYLSYQLFSSLHTIFVLFFLFFCFFILFLSLLHPFCLFNFLCFVPYYFI